MLEESDGLETQQAKKERWLSIRIIYFTMFLMSLGFSIILTGVWPYLDKVSKISAFQMSAWLKQSSQLETDNFFSWTRKTFPHLLLLLSH